MVSFGLDSLMAIQLKNRVEALAGVSISIVKLLEGLTVAQLAAEIDEALSGDDDRPELKNGFGQSGHHEAAWDHSVTATATSTNPAHPMTRSTASTICRSWSSMY